MWTLQEEFARIEIGQASETRNLDLFPLIRRNASQPLDYLLLEDGIAQGKVRVTELSGGGYLAAVKPNNTAALPSLLVDGEEIGRAKERSVLHLAILVA